MSNEINFGNIVQDVQVNKIMLPDFQRNFEWTIDVQKGLVASILTKIPSGSLLLLKADSTDYKSRQIGLLPSIPPTAPVPEKTWFLLDGQQRVTCLTNVFSDVIQTLSGKDVRNLGSSSLLATRFYLRMNPWKEDLNPADDLWGVRTLDFPFDVNNGQLPKFLTADIQEYIECRSFRSADYAKNEPYLSIGCYDDNLDEYCLKQPDGYYIPLFLVIGNDSPDQYKKTTRLTAIIEAIGQKYATAIFASYVNSFDPVKQQAFVDSIIKDQSQIDQYKNAAGNRDQVFKQIISDKASLWGHFFLSYLQSCISTMQINKIEMPEGSRERAIDIYENLNRGGISLSALDLVAARVAGVSKVSLYERIQAKLLEKKTYKHRELRIFPPDYNASKQMKAVEKNRIAPLCANYFLEVLGLLCNNPTYDEKKAKCEFSKVEAILRLSAEQINDYCDSVCVALDRAFCFMQDRCGVMSLSDINYKIMVRLIAYIFTNENWYSKKKVHDVLEAWYWTSVFSGEFDKDQNERFEQNLHWVLSTLKSSSKKKDYSWLLSKRVLAAPYFSDCEFLTMEKAGEGRVPKEHLGRYFCQYFLSTPYLDLLSGSGKNNVLSKKLEKHHIIPLGSVSNIGESSQKLREKKEHICNSPLNFVYISDITNKAISCKSLSEYEKAIDPVAKTALQIVSYPSASDLSDEEKVKQWMRERHEFVMGAIKNEINNLLS